MKSNESRHAKSIRHLLDIEAEADKQIQDSLDKNKQIIADANKEAAEIVQKANQKAERDAKKIAKKSQDDSDKAVQQQLDSVNQDIADLQQQSEQHMDQAVDSLVAWVTAKGK